MKNIMALWSRIVTSVVDMIMKNMIKLNNCNNQGNSTQNNYIHSSRHLTFSKELHMTFVRKRGSWGMKKVGWALKKNHSM